VRLSLWLRLQRILQPVFKNNKKNEKDKNAQLQFAEFNAILNDSAVARPVDSLVLLHSKLSVS
jgi:hypothetical protein